MLRRTLYLLALIGMLVQPLHAGVGQARAVNRTNIGTNAYADANRAATAQNIYGAQNTQAVSAQDVYGTVNPNYSNGQMTYPDNSVASVNPEDIAYANDSGTAIYNGNAAVVTGNSYYDYNSWSGSAAHGNMIPMGTLVEVLPSTATPVMVGGSRYYYDTNIFLTEVFDGGMLLYQVVPAPIGAVVSTLPAGCTVQYFNGKSFSICGNTYYKQVAGGYQVVPGWN